MFDSNHPVSCFRLESDAVHCKRGVSFSGGGDHTVLLHTCQSYVNGNCTSIPSEKCPNLDSRFYGHSTDTQKCWGFCFVLFCFVFVCFFLFVFLGPNPRHMEVPRLGVESELWLQAYTTATATWDPSHICDLHHRSQQYQILNLLSKARDWTRGLMDTSRVH